MAGLVRLLLLAALVAARLSGQTVQGEYRPQDPNYSRLLYGPTGYPLHQGDGYFCDHYVFFLSGLWSH